MARRKSNIDYKPFGGDPEYIELMTELKEVYLFLSAYFKRISKYNDEYFFRSSDKEVEYQMRKALEIRQKIEAYRKKWFEDFSKQPQKDLNNTPLSFFQGMSSAIQKDNKEV